MSTFRGVQAYDSAVPISSLVEHPENPRRGDVPVIEESIERNGFYGAVYAQAATRRVIVGNHRLRAARARGLDTVPVIFLDVDDETARRIMLVDNKSSDLAGYDAELLRRLLAECEGDLVGTGYVATDLSALLAELESSSPEEFPRFDETAPTDHRCPACGYEWSGKAS